MRGDNQLQLCALIMDMKVLLWNPVNIQQLLGAQTLLHVYNLALLVIDLKTKKKNTIVYISHRTLKNK